MELENHPLSPPLEIRSAPAREGIELVSIGGDIDIATAARLARGLREASRRGARGVLLDLSRVGFIDCSGLRVLTEFRRSLEADNRTAALVSEPGGPVDRLLDLAGLRGRFAVHGTLDEAFTAVARAA